MIFNVIQTYVWALQSVSIKVSSTYAYLKRFRRISHVRSVWRPFCNSVIALMLGGYDRCFSACNFSAYRLTCIIHYMQLFLLKFNVILISLYQWAILAKQKQLLAIKKKRKRLSVRNGSARLVVVLINPKLV